MESDNMSLTDLLGAFNLTEEDLDYTNNFEWDRWHEQQLQNHNTTSATSNSSTGIHHGSNSIHNRNRLILQRNNCYCDGWVKEWASIYRSYHGYVALMVCGFGSLANLLNVAVLTRKGLRRAPINTILTGLAAADVLVMLEYIPFAMYMYIVLPERKLFPYTGAAFVLFHMHFSQLLHTLSIALTLTLALWRYIVVR
ncbi:hypothetical protein QAD02_004767 [Eretmocerus hayati]|uniref:Uncharacterized protein n=1 Tax=Eretmocerus hayati TaxID=131215 RepID=A0ACC2NQM3_9HYME|nr:hypothetical protein QAD02_004767 [Eretmocerus hayati]